MKKDDLEYAIERVIAGPEKKTSVLNPIVSLCLETNQLCIKGEGEVRKKKSLILT